MKKNTEIKSLKIGIASPERIRKWSYGEVTKPETINYKSLKPEPKGLFDEAIFGPIKDYECSCGRYKKVKFKGRKCEKCNVEITESIVRRERMGHIELAAPVAHIWMTKELPNPSKISLLLDISYKEVEQVVYFINHIILDEGHYEWNGQKVFKLKEIVDLSNPKNNAKTRTKLRRVLKDIAEMIKNDPNKGKKDIDYDRARTYDEILAEKSLPFSNREVFDFITKYTGIKFGIGAAAIQELLKNIDLEKELNNIRAELKQFDNPNEQHVKKLLRRLETIKWIKESDNKPEWMIMNLIPVTPPDTRPIIQLDGGRFTTSDINTFYRKIIIRNDRLKKMSTEFAPHILLDNECRMLQEAVDSLFDNQSRKKPVVGRDKRPLKSLSSHLKGKQGLFRQNLLGKRVDYSGRSVIVIGPELKMYEVGIPAIMILKLFKPFIINELISKKDANGNEVAPLANSIRKAENMILNQDSAIWPVVEKVIKERPVLLNRAPTLHRLGIQAFEVKMVDGKAIRLHPLVTTAFNADFDGDQMAVHVPLSKEAVAEARSIMLASWHILGPKDGKPIVAPTQDIVLGNYYLSKEKKGMIGEGIVFGSIDEVKVALLNKTVHLHSIIAIDTSVYPEKGLAKGLLITTPGKILFNEALPVDFEYINTFVNNKFLNENDIVPFGQNYLEIIQNRNESVPFGKKVLSNVIDQLYKQYGSDFSTVPESLDKIKELGFKYSTMSATTVSFFDVPRYQKKEEYFKEADEEVQELQRFANKGWLNEDERYTKVVQLWSKVKDKVTKDIEEIVKSSGFKNNSIVVMANSGARGNISNFTQLAGMRGLMSKSYNYDQKTKSKVIKDTIEIPIKHSFIEGLTVSEYFNSTYGARKGLTDTAMKTSKSGYMTRKLVDAAQEVIISSEDCETIRGLEVSEIVNSSDNQVVEKLYDRIVGRYNVYDIVHPKTKQLIIAKNELITNEIANQIENADIKSVTVRSPLYCNATNGICQKCFGIDLSTNKPVTLGTAIGVIAAQSIGEPGTQLTMRTFHTGGVSGEMNITQGFERLKQLFEFTPPKKWEKSIISQISGVVKEINYNDNKNVQIVISNKLETITYNVPIESNLRVQVNDNVVAGSKLTEGLIDIEELLKVAGIEVVRNYIIKEVQKVYRSQGIEISDKYIEVIVNQLTNKGVIVNSGDYDYFVGQTVQVNQFKKVCQDLISKGLVPPVMVPRAFGLENAPAKSNSFLSAASFQDTKKILTDAATKSQVDELLGLKENVILGKLIPAGTGVMKQDEILEWGNEMYKKEYGKQNSYEKDSKEKSII
ncbi:MAG: DNA-directed RNA polymerase subunit beta' [Ureaplasma sp.]|nr:DNA-directed RNA polymerase subunit beta' [Ureaplasma sp.]